ncbi:hypothetical protein CAPTEDRAFT_188985 [Capitella teleta]|uniref:Uncharacterized protein n=1 Tax=Capitella teleta TaxID=283909 RepID=R7VBS7_CAPTE|nr:hypothetical protein CAPTEDRAFT_188985 [Capitella teleta]|eukprot:ELU16017.1 hypothetical protein CAPTEDRAFT_188985 [Capitella teleta]
MVAMSLSPSMNKAMSEYVIGVECDVAQEVYKYSLHRQKQAQTKSVVMKLTLCLSLCVVLLIAFAEAKGKKPKGQKPGKFRPANEAPMFDVQDPPSQEECVEQCIQNTQIYTAEGCEYTCRQMIASSS